MKRIIQYLVLGIVGSLYTQSALAFDGTGYNEVQFGNYIVYYNTFPSMSLEPRIASEVGVKRSHSRNVLTIAVKQQTPGQPEQPVRASITGTVHTLMGHIRTIKLREVNEGSSIYYVGDYTALDQETLTYKLSVHPEGTVYSKQIEFKRGIYSR